ncbi:conjugal transfer protein TraD [Legionella lytica]|uniref:Conjugal transfer protein TraD n=1 Tax=Legionella lytica TaxID=96232 RepID=A0ABW8DAB3_9GAMM
MAQCEQIEKEQQIIARCEKSLALEKLKKRRAETRYKIELGGLIIKSGMHTHHKSVILGALGYIYELLKNDTGKLAFFELKAKDIFNN